MKVCEKCGKTGNGVFCTSCGGKMIDEVVDKPSSTAEYAARQKSQQSSTAQYAANQKSQQSSTAQYAANQKSQQSSTAQYASNNGTNNSNPQQSFKSTSNQSSSYQNPQNSFNQYNQPNLNPSFQTPPAQPYQQPISYSPTAPGTNANIPQEYQPISTWGYVGYLTLFSLGTAMCGVGIIVALVFAFGGTQNVNLRNFSRGFLISLIIPVVVLLILSLCGIGCVGCAGLMSSY